MSEASRRNRIKDLLVEALQVPRARREAFLASAAADDPSIGDELRRLIDAHERASAFLTDPTVDVGSGWLEGSDAAEPSGSPEDAEPAADVGITIDRYRLLQLIGQGGFGSVYLAEQREPVVRKVALKIIKLGMDTRKVIARFEAERQALAMMEHPNIARVFDAGSTDRGRPYFVMELVRGEPITAYCDSHRLSIAQRLDLFRQVCSAVQHAHSKGVIHRDIKPSNVLVTVHDGAPLPKVIDFGIAKATSARLTEKTLFTEFRQLIGTPEYMSPEQADVNASDIDTRADVYSLGVLLYELLTGATPFDGRRLRSAAFNEMQRIIREEDPPRPSTRLSSLETLPSVAANRDIEPHRLTTHLRGDLDWIVMKCLEKDRTRRYETPGALADDIARHLSHEPVAAGPPTTGYRLRKFIRRRRGPVVAGALVLAALVAGIIGTTAAMIRAGRAEREQADLVRVATEQLERLSARLSAASAAMPSEDGGLVVADPAASSAPADKIAALGRFGAAAVDDLVASDKRIRVERDKAERFGAFMEEIMAAVGPTVAVGRDTAMLRDLMDAASARIERGELKDSPLAEIRLRIVIGEVYREIAEFARAEQMLRDGLELARRVNAGDDPFTAKLLSTLGLVLADGKKLEEAESVDRECLEMWRRLNGPDNENVGIGLINLGTLLHRLDRTEESDKVTREGIATFERIGDGDRMETAVGWANIAAIRMEGGDVDGAAPLYEKAFAICSGLVSGDHPMLAGIHHSMAMLAWNKHDPDAAERHFREGLEMCRRLYKGDHTATAADLEGLANVMRSRGKLTEAVVMLDEALGMRRRLLGSENVDFARNLHNLGVTRFDANDFEGAESALREALAIRRRLLPAGHLDIAESLTAIAAVLAAKKDYAASPPLLRELLEMLRKRDPIDGVGLARALSQLGTALAATGAAVEAEAPLRECVDLRKKLREGGASMPPWHVAQVQSLLGGSLTAQAKDASSALSREERLAKLAEAGSLALESYDTMKNDPATPRGMNPKVSGGGEDRLRECLVRVCDFAEAIQSLDPSDGHAAQVTQWQGALADYDKAKAERRQRSN